MTKQNKSPPTYAELVTALKHLHKLINLSEHAFHLANVTARALIENAEGHSRASKWMLRIGDFNALEIHPCMVIGNDSLNNEIVEQCEPEDAHFWTVYGHLRTGGVDVFEDFPTEAEAVAFHDRLIADYPHLADD